MKIISPSEQRPPLLCRECWELRDPGKILHLTKIDPTTGTRLRMQVCEDCAPLVRLENMKYERRQERKVS